MQVSQQNSSRRSCIWTAVLGLALIAIVMAVASPRAEAVITCYHGSTPPSSNCGYQGLAGGAAPIGQIDRSTTTGESMYNASSGTSKRVRIIDGAGNNVAGWWASSTQYFLVTWSARAWVRGQCNNQQSYNVSVNCGFQW
jgi:hypothetical protein